MKKHTKIYLNFFKYGEQDFIPCEYCNSRAVDVHHIDNRGMGGDPKANKDVIENLAGLCRDCHNKAEHIPQFNHRVKQIHLKFIELWKQNH